MAEKNYTRKACSNFFFFGNILFRYSDNVGSGKRAKVCVPLPELLSLEGNYREAQCEA